MNANCLDRDVDETCQSLPHHPPPLYLQVQCIAVRRSAAGHVPFNEDPEFDQIRKMIMQPIKLPNSRYFGVTVPCELLRWLAIMLGGCLYMPFDTAGLKYLPSSGSTTSHVQATAHCRQSKLSHLTSCICTNTAFRRSLPTHQQAPK